MDDIFNNADVTETTVSPLSVLFNRDIPKADGEKAISLLYAYQKNADSIYGSDSCQVEYLAPELTAQIDSFSMYDVVVEILHRLQKENVCSAVPISPQTRLEELFPAKGREKNWNRFVRELQYQDWITGETEFLDKPAFVSKVSIFFSVAFVVILLLSIPIGILNCFNVIECFPLWLKFAYFWTCQFLFFYLGFYILFYFIINLLPFKLYTKEFKDEFNTVEDIFNYLKIINLFRIADPDAETLAKSGCPICKKILAILSCQSKIPEAELNLQSRLDSLLHGNKAHSFWNGLLKEMTNEKFNLPHGIPQELSSRSIIIKWFLNCLIWFVGAGIAIGIGYTAYVSLFNISKSRDFLTNSIPFLTDCLYLWLMFSLVFVNILLAATLIMAIIAMFDYFLFPRYSFPVRYQTVANLVNRFRAANVEWLAENCPESLDAKLRTLAFPKAKQKEVIKSLKLELALEEEEIENC